MYLPSRAIVTEWQRAGVFGNTPNTPNYGAILPSNFGEVGEEPRRRTITIEELIDLEDRAQRIELFDSTTMENITFSELLSVAIPSQMFIRALLPNSIDGPYGEVLAVEDYDLPPDLIMVWNVAMIFLLWIIGMTLFITIMLFVKIQSGT